MKKSFYLLIATFLFSSCSLIVSFDSDSQNNKEICTNGVDDDQDGFVDCDDPDCDSDMACQEICDDDKDNNRDDLVDCYDPQCYLVTNCGCTEDVMFWDSPDGYCPNGETCTTFSNTNVFDYDNIEPTCTDEELSAGYYEACSAPCKKGSSCLFTFAGMMCIPICNNRGNNAHLCPEYEFTGKSSMCIHSDNTNYDLCLPGLYNVQSFCNPLEPDENCSESGTKCMLLSGGLQGDRVGSNKDFMLATCIKPGTLPLGATCVNGNFSFSEYCKAGSICYYGNQKCTKLCDPNGDNAVCGTMRHCEPIAATTVGDDLIAVGVCISSVKK